MNNAIIPAMGSAQAKAKHGKHPGWKLYARRIQKHPYMLQYIARRDNNTCAWCKKEIATGEFHLHHTDYDHLCQYGKTVEVAHPTEKRPNRVDTVPDCQRCAIEAPQHFQQCTSRLVQVHRMCNRAIDQVFLRKLGGDMVLDQED